MSYFEEERIDAANLREKEREELRDRMAMAALPAMIRLYEPQGPQYISRKCYEQADAMLKERDK